MENSGAGASGSGDPSWEDEDHRLLDHDQDNDEHGEESTPSLRPSSSQLSPPPPLLSRFTAINNPANEQTGKKDDGRTTGNQTARNSTTSEQNARDQMARAGGYLRPTSLVAPAPAQDQIRRWRRADGTRVPRMPDQLAALREPVTQELSRYSGEPWTITNQTVRNPTTSDQTARGQDATDQSAGDHTARDQTATSQIIFVNADNGDVGTNRPRVRPQTSQHAGVETRDWAYPFPRLASQLHIEHPQTSSLSPTSRTNGSRSVDQTATAGSMTAQTPAPPPPATNRMVTVTVSGKFMLNGDGTAMYVHFLPSALERNEAHIPPWARSSFIGDRIRVRPEGVPRLPDRLRGVPLRLRSAGDDRPRPIQETLQSIAEEYTAFGAMEPVPSEGVAGPARIPETTNPLASHSNRGSDAVAATEPTNLAPTVRQPIALGRTASANRVSRTSNLERFQELFDSDDAETKGSEADGEE